MTHIGLELEVGSMFRVITHGANVISRLWTEACRDGYAGISVRVRDILRFSNPALIRQQSRRDHVEVSIQRSCGLAGRSWIEVAVALPHEGWVGSAALVAVPDRLRELEVSCQRSHQRGECVPQVVPLVLSI